MAADNRTPEREFPGQSSGQEFYSGQEYNASRLGEYHRTGRNAPEGQENRNTGKKMNKVMRYLFGTISGALLVTSVGTYHEEPKIPLTEEEKVFFLDMAEYLQMEKYDEAVIRLVGEIRYTEDGYPIITDESTLLPFYQELCGKAGWEEEERLTVLMDQDIEVVPGGTGTGFCLKDTKLYYGELKDGLPEGNGICYAIVHNYYNYSQGPWSQGYLNGEAEILLMDYMMNEDDIEYVIGADKMQGTYLYGRANGTIRLNSYMRNSGRHAAYEYKAENGRVIFDEHWGKDGQGRYILYRSDGSREEERHYRPEAMKKFSKAMVPWLPIEDIEQTADQ